MANSQSWTRKFDFVIDSHSGYVDSFEKANDVIRDFEISTATTYAARFQTKDFGKHIPSQAGHKILWFDPQGSFLKYDGIPFQALGRKSFDCQHGPDRNKALKARNAAHPKDGDHSYAGKRKRFLIQNTKKCDCPAAIHLREVVKYTHYKLDSNTKARRESTSKALRSQIATNKAVGEIRYYIKLPQMEDHKNHPVNEDAGIFQPIDDRLVNKIYEFVAEGVNSMSEMERHLRIFVEKELFMNQTPPDETNRRFYPTRVDIRNHMYRATIQFQHSKIDQENLEHKLQEWKKQRPADNFFFRPATSCSKSAENGDGAVSQESLLFVHQTEWQRNLLCKYGNEICLLDATYKTMRYSLPLFFLCVKTNTGYCVVGSFILQHESGKDINEAILVLRKWCPSWDPDFFMVDFSEAEIQAIESAFPECMVYLCDFHREQAWLRWVKKSTNEVKDKDGVLSLLRKVARAKTETELKDRKEDLMASDCWKDNAKLQTWFTGTWFPEQKRWVWCYRRNKLNSNINTTNGVERQNLWLKRDFLSEHRDKTLSGVVTVLVEKFLPQSYKKYMQLNIKATGTYRKYNNNIPLWLHNRPRGFVKHCMCRYVNARNIPNTDITVMENK